MPNPTRIEICCDKTCPNFRVPQEIELTDAEIAQLEADRIAFEAAKDAEDQAKAEIEAAKASAQAKLAALGLTGEEVAALTE